MTGWYSLVPSGGITLGNLTPVGQNSGQVGCRFPPNGHQLAACLSLPNDCQLWGPFWHYHRQPEKIYLILPQTIYCVDGDCEIEIPEKIFRSQWRDGCWQVKEAHQDRTLEYLGGKYLIDGQSFNKLWRDGELTPKPPDLIPRPEVWQPLTLAHNSRDENRLVKEEAGLFAEMTTMMNPDWSILVKVTGNYELPQAACLGAGATPVTVNLIEDVEDEWLNAAPANPQGAVLLTAALWKEPNTPISIPYPIFDDGSKTTAYAAEPPVPWQSWQKTNLKRNQQINPVRTLTPGEWLTPAGAVYLWEQPSPVTKSEPFKPKRRFNYWALGYGHLWLF